MRAYPLSAFLAALLAPACWAQNANYTSVETVAGVAAQIGYYASAKKDCSPTPPPTLRVLTPPKHGVLSVRQGAVTTNKIPNCPQLQTPAQIVFYQGRADYHGPDDIAYEVTAANGAVNVYNISITVKEAPKPPAPAPAPNGGVKL